jgi:hypothetical protein
VFVKNSSLVNMGLARSLRQRVCNAAVQYSTKFEVVFALVDPPRCHASPTMSYWRRFMPCVVRGAFSFLWGSKDVERSWSSAARFRPKADPYSIIRKSAPQVVKTSRAPRNCIFTHAFRTQRNAHQSGRFVHCRTQSITDDAARIPPRLRSVALVTRASTRSASVLLARSRRYPRHGMARLDRSLRRYA